MRYGGKLWRHRLRPWISSFILFGLGVTTCLMFVQMSQNYYAIDGPAVYTNSQEYQPPLDHHQQQPQPPLPLRLQAQELPCDTGIGGAGVNSEVGVNVNTPIIRNRNNARQTRKFGTFLAADKPSNNNRNTNNYYNKLEDLNSITITSPSTEREFNFKSSESEILKNDINNNQYSNNDIIKSKNQTNGGPTVWVITPTFYRPEQKPELTRLAQALLPVRHFIHWILVEDITHGSNLTFQDLEKFVQRFSSINHTILKSHPPKSNTKIVGKPRGVGGRRAAIDWLRKQYENKSDADGVVYFADDDNTYDSDIFRQMQGTKTVSMWPVGLVTDFGVSSPIVQHSKVVGFYDGWSGLRKFPVDMAGFAINIRLFLEKPAANMPWVAGYEEDELLKSLGITIRDIRPLANNCTEILVWHTKAQKHAWPKRPKTIKPGLVSSTNLKDLLRSLPQKSLGGPTANFNKVDSGFSLLNMIFGGQ